MNRTLSLLGAALACSTFASTAFAGVTENKIDTSKLPKGVTFQGTASASLGWTDKNGDNYVIFSSTESTDKAGLKSTYLFVNHFVVKDGKAKNLRTVKDMYEKCEFDNLTRIIPSSLQVTDLDGDNLGEVTFAYTVDCVSDVSPIALKLLLLEGGDKYIIRGTTEVNPGGGVIGGKKEVDASFKKGPKEFLAQAEATWKKVVSPAY